MRRHKRNRIRTWLRDRWLPNLQKGKDCKRGRHEFIERDEGVWECRHCPRTKTQTIVRWAP